ncbi:MAG: branched-chain amino acid ABC transporter substrate-binding protein [Elusimicrobiota bacterium]|nr:MAG: branched-chain amino acid ABC transporter substrate-binding protein [Elusimicrobiota bacterium]
MTFRRALVLAAVVLAAACGPKEKTVRIAVAVPLTGDMGTEGQGLRRAVELAVEEANAAKRFPYKLEAAPYDDRADPKEAVNVANLVVSDPRVVAVVGHYNSGCATPAAKVYARAPIAMVSPAATNPEVTAQQNSKDWMGPRMVFRVVPTDDVQGSYAATFALKKLGKKRMTILHDKSPYGQGLAEEFKKAFLAGGGKIVSEDGVSVGDKDFKALLTKIRNDPAKPEGVYFGGLYTEAGLLLKQMRELGMKPPFDFISGDGSMTFGLFDVAGDSADGAYLSIVGVPADELPSAKKFVEAYKARFPNDERKPFDHFGYEAANIIMAAIERAGGPDREKVIAELKKTKHEGVLGTTVFDDKGDTTSKIVTMTRAASKKRAFDSVR